MSNISSRLLTATVIGAMAVVTPACGEPRPSGNERWVTTENTNVEIDWDAVAQAYKEAEGPEDFEKRVNEIYAGDEVISVSVVDQDEKTQLVTGFFDRNQSGTLDAEEKVFTIRRDITGGEQGQYQIQGHNAYAGYHSPLFSIASGMLLGSMLSRAFSPGYAPMYTQPYVTPASRRGQLLSQRNNYRQQNPTKFRSGQASKSGRQYGAKGSNFGGGRPSPTRSPTRSMPRSGGFRFGAKNRGARRVISLG